MIDPLEDAELGGGRGGRRARALAPAERPWANGGAREQDRGILRPSLADGVYAVDLRALALTLGDLG
jgi:hypothetical protein